MATKQVLPIAPMHHLDIMTARQGATLKKGASRAITAPTRARKSALHASRGATPTNRTQQCANSVNLGGMRLGKESGLAISVRRTNLRPRMVQQDVHVAVTVKQQKDEAMLLAPVRP